MIFKSVAPPSVEEEMKNKDFASMQGLLKKDFTTVSWVEDNKIAILVRSAPKIPSMMTQGSFGNLTGGFSVCGATA